MRQNSVMKSRELEARAAATLGGRGWKTRLAQITGKDYATVKRWANGELVVPEYVIAIIELLERLPEAMRPARCFAEPRRVNRKR